MTWTIIVLAVLALVLWSFYVSWRASRLDRLHNRVEAARTALDLALVRRASAASELASSGLLDPATSLLLADAVRRSRQVGPAERDLAESDLTRALRATLGDPDFRKELVNDDSASYHGASYHGASYRGASCRGGPDHGAADHGAADHGAADHGAAEQGAASHGAAKQGAAELVAELEAAAQQVFIARKFYNDLAGRTVYARQRPLARVLHLSGSAEQPAFFEMDDVLDEEGLE